MTNAIVTYLCCEKEFLSAEALKEHLTTAHKVNEFKGTRTMIMHMDCADAFYSTFRWKIGALEFIQYTTNPRRKTDPFSDPTPPARKKPKKKTKPNDRAHPKTG